MGVGIEKESKSEDAAVRRRTLVSCHQDMRGLLQMFGEEVAEGVVLLENLEVGGVRHAYPSRKKNRGQFFLSSPSSTTSSFPHVSTHHQEDEEIDSTHR